MKRYGGRPVISVVVCTYNRCDLLKGAVDSLISQGAPRRSFEVIVVDNASTDGTRELVNSYGKRVRYVFEKKQGLSHARNAGYKAARGSYVAYLDDDAKAEKGWITRALGIIREQGPDFFGGPIYPFYLSPKPKWFRDEYERRLHAPRTGPLPKKKHVSGSNIFVRRELFEALGGFRTSFGMRGATVDYGEEADFLLRARRKGYGNAYYDMKLVVEHLVPPHKMRVGFYFGYHYRCGRKHKEMVGRGPSRLGALAMLVGLLVRLGAYIVLGLAVRNRKDFPLYRQYLVKMAVKMHLIGRYYSYAFK